MECPVDKSTLQMAERAGVEIDYCPKCRGIWLDRGELDKIIEKSESQPDTNQSTRSSDDRHDNRSSDVRDKSNQSKKGKGSFIGDIFGGFGGED